MSKHDELDARSKLRSSKSKVRPTLERNSLERATERATERAKEENYTYDHDPRSVLDDIWATPYDENAHALSQLELRLYKQKRKIYEVQRLLGQTVETITILLSMLHATLEDL